MSLLLIYISALVHFACRHSMHLDWAPTRRLNRADFARVARNGLPTTSGSHPISAGSPDRDRDHSPHPECRLGRAPRRAKLSVLARPRRFWPIRSVRTSFQVRPPERSSGIDDKNGFAQKDSRIPLAGTAPAGGKLCLRSGVRFRRFRVLLVHSRRSCHRWLPDRDRRHGDHLRPRS